MLTETDKQLHLLPHDNQAKLNDQNQNIKLKTYNKYYCNFLLLYVNNSCVNLQLGEVDLQREESMAKNKTRRNKKP